MAVNSITFIDHYDSFSMNIIQLFRAVEPELEIKRIFCDDHHGICEYLSDPNPLILSPGPKRPEDLPLILDMVQRIMGEVPILGICLGHQILGFLHGAEIYQVPSPHHGTTICASIEADDPLFQHLQSEILVATYNSLAISTPLCGKVLAINPDDQTIQCVRYDYSQPTYGLQFHPESFLTISGDEIVRNWLRLCGNSKFNDFLDQVSVVDSTISG